MSNANAEIRIFVDGKEVDANKFLQAFEVSVSSKILQEIFSEHEDMELLEAQLEQRLQEVSEMGPVNGRQLYRVDDENGGPPRWGIRYIG
ncbi:MAG: hypothetical protein IPM54_25120 [Polyangiaceae bacterium]|nr:hypothetical protein [Polyangiaceae bacterium]